MHSRSLLFAKVMRWLALCVLALGALGVHAMQNAPLEKIASVNVDCAPAWAAQALDSTQKNSLDYGGCTSWGIYMGVDPVAFQEANVHSFNRYAYANNNPYKYVDRDGRYAELAVEVISLSVGYMSLRENMRAGNTMAAIADGVGMLADIAGAALPGVPGVAGLGIKAAREAAEMGGDGTVRVRHYTSNKGLSGIEESGAIKASDQNTVFTESARGKPLSPRDAEATYGLKQGRGRNYVETDVPASQVNRVYNPLTRSNELQIKGDLPLDKATFHRR